MSLDFSRTVAIVGRPNVGKSRLFNRLCGRRLSIVHDMPGVTRDIISAEVEKDYMLLDTGGLGMHLEMTPKQISTAAEDQVEFAIQAAKVILFMVDARSGVTALDEIVAGRLRRFGKSILLIANKVDSEAEESLSAEFAGLGLGEPINVSAEHGRGLSFLKTRLSQALGAGSISEGGQVNKQIKISLVGRPNVGKSSLGNALIHSKRLIVSDVPGTTRDSIELDLSYKHKDGEILKFRLTDTAGLRMKRKVDSSVEYFSTVRTEHTIERSDVVFLVIDAMDGVTKQDQSLAGMIIDSGKAIIIVVNKWDLVKKRWEEEPIEGYKNIKHFLTSYEESLRKALFFLPNPPVLFVSATENFKVESLLEGASSVEPTLDLKLPTGRLNRTIQELFEARSPKLIGVKRFKVFYAVQIGSRPIRIRLYCNRVERLDPTYRRYLEKGLIHDFRLNGCPIWFDLVGKDKRYSDEEGEGVRQSKELQDKARLRKQGLKAKEKKHPERRKKITQKIAAHNQGTKSKKKS